MNEMTLDLEQIKATAQAVDPGPWAAYGAIVRDVDGGEDQVAEGRDPAHARYIAAANPAAVLALLERLERAEADVRRLDSGVIMTRERDDFGDEYKCERRGLDLRAMIDEAIEAEKRGAQPGSAG